jgi:hypothetical protein
MAAAFPSKRLVRNPATATPWDNLETSTMAYFANGTEGDILQMQCCDCPLGFGWNDPRQGQLFEAERIPKGCPVHAVQMLYNYDQVSAGQEKLRAAMNVLIDERGVCQVRKVLEETRLAVSP